MAYSEVKYKQFRGVLATWETLFRNAAEFASGIAPANLIGISHSSDHSDGVVTVWYRE